MPPLAPGQIYRLWARVGETDVLCGDFGAGPDGQVLAQFLVPVESYTAPIPKPFLTVETSGASATPSGPTVIQSA